MGSREVRWEGKEIRKKGRERKGREGKGREGKGREGKCVNNQVGFSPTGELWEVVFNLQLPPVIGWGCP